MMDDNFCGILFRFFPCQNNFIELCILDDLLWIISKYSEKHLRDIHLYSISCESDGSPPPKFLCEISQESGSVIHTFLFSLTTTSINLGQQGCAGTNFQF